MLQPLRVSIDLGMRTPQENYHSDAPRGNDPSIVPHWSHAAKQAVGTSRKGINRIWFTLTKGIITECYHPRPDYACLRRLEFIVTDGSTLFSQESSATRHEIQWLAKGAPAFHQKNTEEHYSIEKEIISDPVREALLLRVRFVPIQGDLVNYHLYVILEPHLGLSSRGNTAWLEDVKGIPMLFARHGDDTLALASSVGWIRRSVGFLGASDGYGDLRQHKQMQWEYQCARDGVVMLTGEIPLKLCQGEFLLVIGFGDSVSAAGHQARASLLRDFDEALSDFSLPWQEWQKKIAHLDNESGDQGCLYRASAAVLCIHEAKAFPGAIVASLSVPWGPARDSDKTQGYHLVWTRDLFEAVGALLAAEAHEEARRVIGFLAATQESDGHWSQNTWVDGHSHWHGIQLDEAGFPIILVECALRHQALKPDDLARLWPMISRAANFLVRNGPVTPEDRWEHDGGYAPFTLAVEITALLAAASIADKLNHSQVSRFLRETADHWNSNIERWTYIEGTSLAKTYNVSGHYMRIAPGHPRGKETAPLSTSDPRSKIANSPSADTVSPDILALVRFGLRSADDPRILNTIQVIDATLKGETPNGPSWHRYTGDRYGEKEDGSPFDEKTRTGIGRLWPLLTGERAHYEIAAGNIDYARKLMHAMECFAGESALLPEQVWNAPDIPSKDLFRGHPTGSARPLVWAHAEYIKLLRSLRDRVVFDLSPHAWQRYIIEKQTCRRSVWRFNSKLCVMPPGNDLRIETLAPARVRWTSNDWHNSHDIYSTDSGLGIHYIDLPNIDLNKTERVIFTFFWLDTENWEGQNFEIAVKKMAG